MNPLKAIIFDMDGTLAETEEIHRQAFNIAFAEFDLPLNWSIPQYRRLLSICGGKERIRLCLKAEGSSIPYQHVQLYEFAERIHARKSAIYREKLRRGEVQLRPGIKRLLQEASTAGVKLAIATASSSENVATLLETTMGKAADRLFATIASSDIIEDKKPSPVVYQFCLAKLGLEAADCIAIEDTGNGNLAARRAGLKTIITTHNLTIDNDFSGASLVVNHLGEPGLPFTVSSGDALAARYVDLALLCRLLMNETPASHSSHLN